MNKRKVVLFSVVAILTAVAGCSSGPVERNALPGQAQAAQLPCERQLEPSSGDILIRGEIGDASVLLPILACDASSTQITDLVFSGLLKYDKDVKLVGDLAEKWEISEDKLKIRFHLRKNVRWHDGKPFTAADVEYTYRVYVDPKTPAPMASAFMRIRELRVLGKYSVEAVYGEPFAPALTSWVTNKILPRHLLDGSDITKSPLKRNPIGTGPYKFVEWKTGEKIVLDANPDYYAGRPYLNRLIVRVIPDQGSMFLNLKSGGLDRMRLTPIQYSRQTETPWFRDNFTKYRFTDFGYVYLGYNLKDWKFKDKKVRQALTTAINREGIVQGVLQGLAEVAHSPYKPDSFWCNTMVKKWPYNRNKAAQMLAEAGWADTDGDGILDKDGKPFEFTIITNQGNEARKNAATMIQRHLKRVGIKVNIRILEWAAFLKDFLDKRNFEAYMCGWISEMDPDCTDQWNSKKTGENQFNHVGYCNEEVDRVLELGVRTHDAAERKKHYDRFQEILAEDQPCTFLWVIENLDVIHARFQGIRPGPVGIDYNFEKWFVPQPLRRNCMQQ